MPFYVPTESRTLALEEDTNTDAFWVRLKQRAGESPGRPVLLLVHGYNYGFERACRMGADLQRRLEGEAEVVLFSWPSDGNPANYLPDQVDVEWSVPFLARTIQQIHDHMGPETPLHLLAHSIGSRGAFYALDRLNVMPETQPPIDQLILMAPDFDGATFVDAFDWIRPLVGHVTLYASVNDTPLALSEQLNGYPRLGQAGERLTLLDGMDTIDVSEAGRYQITGHEYHLYHPRVGADLAELVSTRRPAASRSGLAPRMRGGFRYWAIIGTDNP
jgi:esterase/lipase superfamily enzyme